MIIGLFYIYWIIFDISSSVVQNKMRNNAYKDVDGNVNNNNQLDRLALLRNFLS